jgi:hypothetical protein
MTAQQKLNDYKARYPQNFDANKLDKSLTIYQLWDGGTMITAQLTRQEALTGISSEAFYVISDQAVGTIKSLLQ